MLGEPLFADLPDAEPDPVEVILEVEAFTVDIGP
jgi:hypothetical protein